MKTPNQLIAETKNKVIEIKVEKLYEKYLEYPDLISIDVREPEEYKTVAIDRAVNFPRGMLEMKIAQHPLVNHHCEIEHSLQELSEKDIYLICGTGARSALSIQALQNMGLEKLYSVEGGMQAWIDAGYPTISYLN